MHGIVSNLEKRGLVERKNDVAHGRILCTELTSQGQEVVKQAHELNVEVPAETETTVIAPKSHGCR